MRYLLAGTGLAAWTASAMLVALCLVDPETKTIPTGCAAMVLWAIGYAFIKVARRI